MSDWQPIETAPMNGAEVLLFDRLGDISVARFANGAWQARADGFDAFASDESRIEVEAPSHWMPLPSPPPA